MNKIKILLGASALLFSCVLNATIIQYSISGEAHFGLASDYSGGNPYELPLTDITGTLYISDVGTPINNNSGYEYDVISFSFNIGDYGYGGESGHMASSHSGTEIMLYGTGGLNYEPGFIDTWEGYGIFPVLPESHTFHSYDGPPTLTADGNYISYIETFTITKTSSVPEPSIAILLASGLIAFGVVRRKSRV